VRWQSIAVPLASLLVAALALIDVTGTPEVTATTGAGTSFSADRARLHLPNLASAPHPPGSAEHDEVRDYLVDRLRALGLSPSVEEATVVNPVAGSSHVAGRPSNVTATLRGTASTGRVLLVAHYDSVVIGPGATDDGIGVSTILEVARALVEDGSRRNDVQILFTDCEEFGLFGSQAFTAGPSGSPERSVLLNLDARGTSGRVVMYETGEHSAAVVPALRHAPPVTTSLAGDVYRQLPNETDFVRFKAAGFAGLNFAVIGGSARYDTPQDDAAHTDAGTQQDMGDTVLATTLDLAAADLGRVGGESELTYFTVAGVLVWYPAGAVLPLAALVLALLLAAFRYARPSLREVGVGVAAVPLALAAAAALGWLGWQVVVLIAPALADFDQGDPYAAAPFRYGLVILAVVAALLWLVWVRRRATSTEITASIVVWLAVLAAVTAFLVPGGSYLFAWPALAGAVGIALAAALPEEWRPVALSLPALAGVLLIAPIALLLFDTVGLALAAVPLVLVGLLGIMVGAPTAEQVRPRQAVRASGVAVLAAVGLLGTSAAVHQATAGTPTQVSLMYGLDADRGQAYWVSEDPDGQPWVDQLVGPDRPVLEERFPYFWAPDGVRAAAAPVAEVPRPTLRQEASTVEGDTRRITLRVGAESGRPALLALYVDTGGTTLERATVASTDLPGGVNRPFTETRWKWGVVFSAPPADGLEVVLTTRGPGPVRVLLATHTGGVPVRAPDTVTWSPEASGISLAVRTFEL